MQSTKKPRIGYIGVDILNNATICNETTALLQRDVRLDLVSVYKIENPTFYKSDSLGLLDGRIHHLYPLRLGQTIWDLIRAPFVFRSRFLRTCWKALTGKSEGTRQRIRLIGHLIPAVRLANYWRSRGIGHIHCQWAHTATTIGMHAAELLGIGFSFMGHANDLFVNRVALEDKLRRARFVLCISEYHRRLYEQLGAVANRLQVVYCGIALDRFRDLRPLDANASRIVSVGRLVEKKGYHDLIRACSELRDRGLEFECVIAGSGPEEKRLQDAIDRLGLAGIVHITKEDILQEELPDFLKSARVFALPCVQDRDGDMDGLPQVLIESMACGLPVVSTFLAGIPDLIRHEENGLLVETGNVTALANAIERLLRDDELATHLVESAKSWVASHFGRDDLACRLEILFEEAVKEPGNAPPTCRFQAAPGSADCYERPHYDAVSEAVSGITFVDRKLRTEWCAANPIDCYSSP